MSCCSCGNGCAEGCGCRIIVLPDNPVELYSMANINTLGIGVYDSTDGKEFDMRGIASGNSSLIVTLDATNHAIILTLNIDQIIDDLPQATTTQRGVGETATDAEAITKASITTFLTPSNLAALGASLTFAGLAEFATNAETQAGASAALAVTPAGLASVVTTLGTTETWADAAARAALAPDFDGQLGSQLNTNIPYLANGTAAGGFSQPLFVLGSLNNTSPLAQTILDLNSQDFNISNGIFKFQLGTFSLGDVSATDFDFGVAVNLQIAGVQIPASSVFGTGAAGVPVSRLLTTFLSNSNTTVWGAPTGTLARTILASYAGQNISNPPTEAEVQTLDDAVVALSQHVCALITDLRATLKPHAT